MSSEQTLYSSVCDVVQIPVKKDTRFSPAECETLFASVTGTCSRLGQEKQSGTEQSVTPTLCFRVKMGLEVKIYCVIYVLDLAF